MKTCEAIAQIKPQNHAMDIARYWMMRRLQEDTETNQIRHCDHSRYVPVVYGVEENGAGPYKLKKTDMNQNANSFHGNI